MTAAFSSPHVQRVLDAFDRVRPSGKGWSARCPSHKDRKNSLSINVGSDDRILLHCHAGCDPGMVLYHKGLTFRDLAPPRAETVPQNGASSTHDPEPVPAAPPEA